MRAGPRVRYRLDDQAPGGAICPSARRQRDARAHTIGALEPFAHGRTPQRCGRESTTYQPRAEHLEYRIMLVGSNRRKGQRPSQRGIPPAQQPGTAGLRSGPARRALAPARPTNAGISTLFAAIRTAGSPPSDRPGACGRGSRLNGPRATVPPREGRGRRRREIAPTGAPPQGPQPLHAARPASNEVGASIRDPHSLRISYQDINY
jgi:hypothetical protein